MAEVIDAALAKAGKQCDLGNDPAKYLERFEEWYGHTSLLADKHRHQRQCPETKTNVAMGRAGLP